MKPTKEVVALTLDALVAVILTVAGWFIPSVVVDVIKVLFYTFGQAFVLALLYKWLKLEVAAMIRAEFSVLRASLRK